MLGGGWLLLTFGLAIASVSLRETPLYLATILVFFTGGMARVWARHLFTRVEYTRTLSRQRVFMGDEVVLEITVSNGKILPLPWFRVEEEAPLEAEWSKAVTTPSHNRPRRMLTTGLSLGPYHRLTKRFVFTAQKRGFFTFGPSRLEAGDFFGFLRRVMTVEDFSHLVVYPKVVPLERLGIPPKDLFGDIRVRKHLFEDPVRVATTREYAPGDPMNRIHWKSSARLGRLQTKVFEPTTSVDAAIFLDSRTVPRPHWGFVEELLELGVTTAASIASYATEQDIRVGLYVNQSQRLSDRMIQIPPSSHPDQLIHVLEALAQVQPQELFPIERLVQMHARNLAWNATMMVISAAPHPNLVSLLTQYQRAGRRVALVILGRGWRVSSSSRIPTYHVSDALPWDRLESIRISGGLA